MPNRVITRSSWFVRYGGALAAVGAALLVRLGLTALVGEGLPTYITFYPAVMAVALLGGFGPGVVATAASTLVASYWLLLPIGHMTVARPVEAVGLAFFTGMGLFVSLVMELYRRARERAAIHALHVPPWQSTEEPPTPLVERLLLDGGLVLSLAILAAAGWQAHRSMVSVVKADRLVTHTYVVNEEIEHFLMALQEVESGVRGYVATGQEEFVRAYATALPESTNRLAALKERTLDSPEQTQLVMRLEPLLSATMAAFQETIELRQTQGLEAAQSQMATGKSRVLGEEIRRLMAEAQREEDRLLEERIQAKSTGLRRASQALLSGGLLGVLVLAAVFVFLNWEKAARRRAEADLRQHRDHLREIVAARTAELAQANESLRRSREDLNRAEAVAQIGWWRLDTRQNVLTWSDENHRIFGVPKGTPLTYEAFLATVHPDDRQYVHTQWNAGLRGQPYDIEHRIVADGQVKWVREKAYLEFDDAGALRGGFGITQDITARKQGEEQVRQYTAQLETINLSLQESRRAALKLMEDALQARRAAEAANAELRSLFEQRRLALEAADMGAWDYHFQTGEVFWDERCREMWGMAQSEQTDYSTAINRIHPEDRPGVDSAVQEALAGRTAGAYHREFRVVWPDGSIHWIASHGRVYFEGEDGQRKPIRFIGAVREITAEKKAQAALQQTRAELERSNLDLEQFAYVASHDLQEPLRAVGGYVKLLEHRFPDRLDAKAREFVAGAVDGALRMERLINDLLALSRVGTHGSSFVPADLEAVLDQVLRNLAAAINSARATITHEPLPTVAVDATQMMQLFQNLIGNALKFRREPPPRIHVGVKEQDGGWVFSVGDNGIGMEPQYCERIFQVFQRLHTRRQYPGTGIGLAICKRIVERHGGKIWVESQRGQGATFYFSIPSNPVTIERSE